MADANGAAMAHASAHAPNPVRKIDLGIGTGPAERREAGLLAHHLNGFATSATEGRAQVCRYAPRGSHDQRGAAVIVNWALSIIDHPLRQAWFDGSDRGETACGRPKSGR